MHVCTILKRNWVKGCCSVTSIRSKMVNFGTSCNLALKTVTPDHNSAFIGPIGWQGKILKKILSLLLKRKWANLIDPEPNLSFRNHMCHVFLHPSSLPHYRARPSILTPGNFIMAYKALLERVKRQKQSCLKYTKMQDTVNAYWREQGKPIEEHKGAHKIAEENGIKISGGSLLISTRVGEVHRKHMRHNKTLPLQKKRFSSTSLMNLQIAASPDPS